MNKTININLGGIFFHIDETAYQKLKRYLDAVRKSLSDDPKGRDEIISDIELRISELLSDRVKDPRQVVSESDIEEVITVMGQPEDYLIDEEIFNEDDKRSYKKSNYGSTGKRLFRDGDDKFLGGVCSGVAYYFDIDVIWIRIFFLIAVFAGFGTGILIYVILWILLPEAKTTAEKLQMEGEPVNISNIEKRVRSEFENASESIKGAVDEVSGAVKDGYNNVSNSIKKKELGSRTRSGIHEIVDALGRVITMFFKIIGKFIGILLIIVSISTIIGLIVGLFTAGTVDFMGADWLLDDDFVLVNTTNIPIWLISLLLLVLIGIPFLMLFFLGLFIISGKTRIISRTAKFALLGVWLIALLTAIYFGVKQGAEFARDGHVIETKDFLGIPSDTLTIKMVQNENLTNNFYYRHRSDMRKILDENDQAKLLSTDINLYIEASDSTEAYIKLKKKASGRTRLIAKENAKEIDYDFNQKGNVLSLNNYFLTDTDNGYRNQDLRLTVYIPKGQIIYIDKSNRSFLGWIDTIENLSRRDMLEHYYIMTDKGLDCLDCIDESENENEEDNSNEDEEKGVKLNIDKNGVELKIKDAEGDTAEVKINEDGVRIN